MALYLGKKEREKDQKIRKKSTNKVNDMQINTKYISILADKYQIYTRKYFGCFS